jgi:hypothetical protein
MTDVPQTRWARTTDGACIAYQDLGSGPITLLVTVKDLVAGSGLTLQDRGEHALEGIPEA